MGRKLGARGNLEIRNKPAKREGGWKWERRQPLAGLSIPSDSFRISIFGFGISPHTVTTEFQFDSPHPAAETPRPFAMRHTISVLVENKFGVLTRIAGMFSGRGFNIDSLNVGPTLDPTTSRMTIVVKGDDTTLEQVTKQLNKLIDVIKIEDFRDEEIVERELVLMRVNVNSETRAEVMQIGDIFRAKIIDVQINNLAIEITGNESKIDKFLMLMGKFGITELTRTGRVALARKSH
jgi:acetolactate synthase-1/3 small subunit